MYDPVWRGPRALHMYTFDMCVQKSLRALGRFRYDGVSTPFISRAILLHEEASTKVTSGFETGCVFVDRSLSVAYVEQTGH